MIATINGTRLLISGSGDGGVYAIKAQTGEKVWGFMAAKRAINTGVASPATSSSCRTATKTSRSTSSGLIAAIDGSQKGDIKTTIWAHTGDQFGFSSPVIDGNRVYQMDNTGRLKAYDVAKGTRSVDACGRRRAEGAAGAWPTASCISARKAAESSSSGRGRIAPRF